MLIDYEITPELYAKLYANLDITGSIFLGFRDIPYIISKYALGTKTLDYGCGAGKSTVFLKSINLDVEGVDINSTMIDSARKFDPTGIYTVISSAKIPVEDNTYDIIFSSWVLMEISTKQEIIRVIKEMKRVLNKNGLLVILVCNENTYNREWLSEDTCFEENKNPHSGSRVKIHFKDANFSIYDYFWTEEDYKEIILASDLNLIKIHKPLGFAHEKQKWINELSIAPLSIYIINKRKN